MQRRTKISLCFILAIGAITVWAALPIWMEQQMRSALSAQGITVESIGKIHAGLDGAEFVDIKLDKDGFNTIDSLYLQGLFFYPALIIKNVALTGEIGADGRPHIDGWDMRPLTFPSRIRSAILEDAKLDLETAAGSLRIEAKGQMVTTGNDARHIDGVLHAEQNQLGFDTNWDIGWNPDNTYSASAEIGTLRVKMNDIELTRASGWLSIQSTDASPAVTGQLTAGMLVLGPQVLRETTLTVNGPDGNLVFILEGRPAQHDDMRVYADIRNAQDTPVMNARLTAHTLDQLAEFIRNLRTGMKSSPAAVNALSGLMLTDGNMARIKGELKGFAFDTLTLSLSGPIYGLNGSVIASRKNSAEKKTVSFDPAKH